MSLFSKKQHDDPESNKKKISKKDRNRKNSSQFDLHRAIYAGTTEKTDKNQKIRINSKPDSKWSDKNPPSFSKKPSFANGSSQRIQVFPIATPTIQAAKSVVIPVPTETLSVANRVIPSGINAHPTMPILSSNILTLPLLLPTPNLASSPTPDTQVSRPVPLSVSSQALPGSSIPSHTPMMQPSTFPSDPPATSNNSTESGLPGIAIAGICIGLGVLLSSILTIALIRRARKASPDKALKSGPRYTKPQRYGSTTSVILTASPTEDPAWPQPIGTFTVIATYTPTLDDELPIQPGDRVLVYMEYDDGWCLGATMSGTRGVFPKHCISQTE